MEKDTELMGADAPDPTNGGGRSALSSGAAPATISSVDATKPVIWRGTVRGCGGNLNAISTEKPHETHSDCAEDPFGSPLRYTDGTYSREYEDQPASRSSCGPAQNDPLTQQPDDCRAAFERYIEPYGYGLTPAKCHCCTYDSLDTQSCWLGWAGAWEARSPMRETGCGWKRGTDRSMTMWDPSPKGLIKHSHPLIFKTVIPDVGTHLRLGFYDANRNAFIESGIPDQEYRERVECWYQFPMPDDNTRRGPETKGGEGQ